MVTSAKDSRYRISAENDLWALTQLSALLEELGIPTNDILFANIRRNSKPGEYQLELGTLGQHFQIQAPNEEVLAILRFAGFQVEEKQISRILTKETLRIHFWKRRKTY